MAARQKPRARRLKVTEERGEGSACGPALYSAASAGACLASLIVGILTFWGHMVCMGITVGAGSGERGAAK